MLAYVSVISILQTGNVKVHYCVKSVRIRSYSGHNFHAFGLNTERYSVSLCIQSKCGKIQTRITPNTDTFYSVHGCCIDVEKNRS